MTGAPSGAAALPQIYPFRFVEGSRDGGVVVRLSAGATWGRAGGPYPLTLAVEILAQAAILLLPQAGEEGRALLAGIEAAELHRDLVAGERLTVHVEPAGGLGRLVKARGWIEGESGEAVAEARLLLARE